MSIYIVLRKSTLFVCFFLSSLFPSFHAYSADHFDFPASDGVSFPQLDISDVFAWVPQQGKLALAMNLHPLANETSTFSTEDVEYRFRIRPVELEELPGASVLVSRIIYDVEETTVSCSVEDQIASCSVNGHTASTYLNHPKRFRSRASLQIAAGTILDPFYAHFPWFLTRIPESTPNFDPNADPDYVGPVALENPSNLFEDRGVLNLTAVLDISDILGLQYQYFAVAGDLVLDGQIVERMGRPEISNMVVRAETFRDDYNGADTFDLTDEEQTLFSSLIAAGIEGWDKLDKREDWSPVRRDALVETFLLDALIINVAERCRFRSNNLFDIERAAGALRPYAKRCGGRAPISDAVDTIASFLVSGSNALKDTYGDGIDAPPNRVRRKWPYFIPFEKR